jgi:hypothetical protein
MSWNIFSRSRREDPPRSPSSVSPISALTAVLAPASAFARSWRDNVPKPLCPITSSAVLAAMKSASLANEVPPGLTALTRISSSLFVVGTRTTRAPFESRHSVRPIASRVEVVVIVPGVGGVARSGLALPLSTYAPSVRAPASLTIAASVASVGGVTPARSGALMRTTRLASGIQFLATALTSASVISGRNRSYILYS